MMPAGVAGDLPQGGHVMALKAVHELQRTKLDHNSWLSAAGGRGSGGVGGGGRRCLQFFQRLK